MGVSNWYLFFGGLFCCTGFGLPLGIFLIVYWFYKDFMDKGVTVNHVNKEHDYPTYGEEVVPTEEGQTFKGHFGVDKPNGEYKFKGNITDLKDRERYI